MNLTASTVNLTASTSMMRNKADEVTSYTKGLEECFSRINSRVLKLEEYWTGDAANTYNEMYRRQIEIAYNRIDKLKTHTQALHDIAGIFDQTEAATASAAEEIHGNVID